jgi:glycosyltransferase involved in cell wall biosynthesis
MNITYLIDGSDNSLYDGRYALSGGFHTYGQQTYILDLLTALARHGHAVRVVARQAERLPVLTALEGIAGITTTAWAGGPADLLLIDEVADDIVAEFDPDVPAMRIIHDAQTMVSPYLADRCVRFLCMTENAVRVQQKLLPPEKCVLLRQGVDLRRFSPLDERTVPERPRLLMYCRLDDGREKTLTRLIENVDRQAIDVRVVGDGPGFWELERRFGDEILLMNHVPNRSVPRLLSDVDVVISLGRGAMEAMASDLPVLCAGYGYAGLVTATNLAKLLERNLTAYGHDRDPGLVMADIRDALATPRGVLRALAEQHFNVDAAINLLTSSGVGR